jgi:predicted 3-demethylubiquinone-9 3-methyltransferase (glyoxalase superfamily)
VPGVSNEEITMPQRITPFLWFDSDAEEAANFYISIFPNSEITEVSRYGEAGPRAPGSVMVASFRLDGQELLALNGGPEFTFNEAVSFSIACTNQEEVDYYWEKLTDGGEPGPCGWLKDRFGLSWQVNPTVLTEMLQDEDRERANRVMQAMLQMGKIDIAELQAAYEGRGGT